MTIHYQVRSSSAPLRVVLESGTASSLKAATSAARAAAKRIARYVYSASVIIDYYDDNLKLLSREQSSNPSASSSHTSPMSSINDVNQQLTNSEIPNLHHHSTKTMDQKTLNGYLLRHIAYILGDRESAIDLSGSDLRRLSLIQDGLTTAHLRGATINDCLMQSSNLCCADLNSTRLRSSVLDASDLSGADLADADLTDASLRGCNLKEAYLFDTKLIGADLTNADLRGATISHTNLAYCNLNGARFDDFDVPSTGPTPEQWAVIRNF